MAFSGVLMPVSLRFCISLKIMVFNINSKSDNPKTNLKNIRKL